MNKAATLMAYDCPRPPPFPLSAPALLSSVCYWGQVIETNVYKVMYFPQVLCGSTVSLVTPAVCPGRAAASSASDRQKLEAVEVDLWEIQFILYPCYLSLLIWITLMMVLILQALSLRRTLPDVSLWRMFIMMCSFEWRVFLMYVARVPVVNFLRDNAVLSDAHFLFCYVLLRCCSTAKQETPTMGLITQLIMRTEGRNNIYYLNNWGWQRKGQVCPFMCCCFGEEGEAWAQQNKSPRRIATDHYPQSILKGFDLKLLGLFLEAPICNFEIHALWKHLSAMLTLSG